MNRRRLLQAALAAALTPRTVRSQTRIPRVCLLAPFPKTILAPLIVKRLGELGYREGQTMELWLRSADGVDERYPKLARELIEASCSVIFSLGQPASRALRAAGTPVPVVFLAPDHDPLEAGIVDSLSRPAGSITGVYSPSPALAAKRFELAREVLPGATRFFVLVDIHSKDQLAALRKVSDARGAKLIAIEFTKPPYDLRAAFDRARAEKAEALIAFNSPLWGTNRGLLSELISSHRIPAFVAAGMGANPGVLAGFGHSDAHLASRAAELGVRILKGARPADIPVEQLAEYELVVNLKTAKALGLKIPYAVMARATQLIE